MFMPACWFYLRKKCSRLNYKILSFRIELIKFLKDVEEFKLETNCDKI